MRRISAMALLFLIVLLVIPTIALLRLSHLLDPRPVCGYTAFIWVLTWLIYRHDKKRAESGGWRTPESTLHLVELAGGWPAAFLAQRVLRHKSTKLAYQFMFWIIVALHEAVSFDFLQGWRFSKGTIALMER